MNLSYKTLCLHSDTTQSRRQCAVARLLAFVDPQMFICSRKDGPEMMSMFPESSQHLQRFGSIICQASQRFNLRRLLPKTFQQSPIPPPKSHARAICQASSPGRARGDSVVTGTGRVNAKKSSTETQLCNAKNSPTYSWTPGGDQFHLGCLLRV